MAQQVCVILSAVEREQLDPGRSQSIAKARRAGAHRARIGGSGTDTADCPPQRLSRPTVWRWQQRFAEMGLKGCCATTPAKPGKASIAADQAAQLVAADLHPNRHISLPIGPAARWPR
jgi:hypothetical protein